MVSTYYNIYNNNTSDDVFIKDNRFFTSFTHSRHTDQNIQKNNNIKNIFEYKFFLQNKALDLLNHDSILINNINNIDINHRNDNKYVNDINDIPNFDSNSINNIFINNKKPYYKK